QMLDATADLRDVTGTRRFPILVGLMPLLSERNAEYLHNEVPGIVLTDEARRRMKGLSGKDGRTMGLKICKELIDHMSAAADGFSAVPPKSGAERAGKVGATLQENLPRLT